MKKTLAFIGTGNMGGAMVKAACRAVPPENVTIADHDNQKAGELARQCGCKAAQGNVAAALAGDIVFIAVKPLVVESVLREITPVLKKSIEVGKPKAVVSIAAGVTIEMMRGFLGGIGKSLPVLRILPNTPVAIGKGVLGMSADTDKDTRVIDDLKVIFGMAGVIEVMTEKELDAFTIMTGCGLAYACEFINAMADGGVMIGIPRKKAIEYAALAVRGAAYMVLETGEHPCALKDAVCSPGGSTIVGVAELARGGMRAAAINAVCEAYKRGLELGKK